MELKIKKVIVIKLNALNILEKAGFMGAERILRKVLETKESGGDLKAGAIQYIEKMPRYLFIHLSMMHGGN